ncbi:hypothetical protein [Nostoc sp.]|uniref:hypothetical protein n=1 Tax=Nostoc sp. TaxID=1180 RepID=UPI002FFD0894
MAENADIGKALNAAMKAIEDEIKMLQGVLPKEYTSFEQDLLIVCRIQNLLQPLQIGQAPQMLITILLKQTLLFLNFRMKLC